ncbi:hypothetical protein ALQ93_01579 [Pseudomonas syringae pv. pisi]|uniref:DUF262 domain-containing protein n=4 Tax=Pseudomonas syringae group TaxID=136849 RepID=F3GAQ2_PSESJ|nr:hypothetical protein PSYPI_17872 [Pseudomonas syringae pv. pisi str. 1704B]RML58173.1 hypothetical protein ALQ93_01579 [Pseudomonas syringae pv. pisi]RMU90094.1 hypothetical protein ALP21_200042 [Pseudomonas savastanoi pv. phaseolicola]RML66846.1 hypothetical protein ALQ92_02795 [Pseudomonas syringae pv. pisi]RMM24853.1 hypothetical protein ALQ82_03273 [Pseudomonas syringae pv. pisi]
MPISLDRKIWDKDMFTAANSCRRLLFSREDLMSIDVLKDKRTGCLSAILTISANKYLSLIEQVYEQKGGIKGQRAQLKTKTGIRIRARMVKDIAAGAVLPPIVLGAILDENSFQSAEKLESNEQLSELIQGLDSTRLSIIDGMQRTTALLEASEITDISENVVRLEIWIATGINSLIYRMLILNTGQVPWDIKRQLETIYEPILNRIRTDVSNIDVLVIDQTKRRTEAGQYQASKLIEFFLAFSSRKTNIDIKEKVAEDFVRMDAAEATANESFVENFICVLKILATLDTIFFRGRASDPIDGRFKNGKDIFTSTPAGLGFVTAAAVYIFGAPGYALNPEIAQAKAVELNYKMTDLQNRLEGLGEEQLFEFLELVSLNERVDRPSGKVGEFEREFFFKAFSALFFYAPELPNMEVCWAAY